MAESVVLGHEVSMLVVGGENLKNVTQLGIAYPETDVLLDGKYYAYGYYFQSAPSIR
jgi:hypothetical protein